MFAVHRFAGVAGGGVRAVRAGAPGVPGSGLIQTLDNCDGKQARKLGLSTPLGMMFDHGVDSLCVSLCTVIVAQVLAATPLQTYFILAYTSCTFFLVNYEAARLGHMDLPLINGPSEGNFMLGIFCMTPYFLGDHVFAHTYSGYTYTQIIIYTLFVWAFFTSLAWYYFYRSVFK